MAKDIATIGMVGGLTWVSTAHYYTRVNQLVAEKLGGDASAKLLLASVNRQRYVDAYLHAQDDDAAFEVVLEAAKRVEDGGADFLVICCNNAHRFVPGLERELKVPILHIVSATAKAIRAAGLTRVGLLGVEKTMLEPFFPELLAAEGIETLIPEADDRATINKTIYDELIRGIFREETRDVYRGVVDRLVARGAQGVILGCTEIPLLIGPDDLSVPSFSTTELHCEAAVERAVAGFA